MPVTALVPLQDGLTIRVGSGCGIGVHRGSFDGCAPIYGGYDGYDEPYLAYREGYHRGYHRGYYRGYHDAHYDGPYVRYYYHGDVVVVDRGLCGFGSYLSCGYGTCWRYCY